jgi:hypothetical protein
VDGCTRDVGQGPVAYIAVLLVITAVAGVLTVFGLPVHVRASVCLGDANCTGRVSASQAALEQVRDYLGHLDEECAWYKPWDCGGPERPQEFLDDLSPSLMNAVFYKLGHGEMRRLLEQDGVVDVLKVRAGPSLLHHLESVAPGAIEPGFSDVLDRGKKPADPAIGWGVVEDGQLFGPDGQASLDDIDQGSIRDCWWLAGMGALANTAEGRRLIRNMIRQNSNGTYTVTFADRRRVTVTPYFPVKKNDTLAYARPNGKPPVVWPLVLEKALAEKRGSYGRLVQGDGGDAMQILTGMAGKSMAPAVVGRDELERWLDEGGVTLLTPDQGGDIYEGDGARLNTDHVYVVEGLTGDGRIKLYNPWGTDHAVITMDEFRKHFEDVDFNPVR